MDSADVRPGMTVADIGAGGGYYTVRLAPRVGQSGRVLAQDIQPEVIERLADRVARERLDNAQLKLGAVDDPRLPAASFDRVFMVHMYHEIGEPYAFLWRLRPALRQDGQVIVVDGDRPIAQHGTPFRLLVCEFEAVGSATCPMTTRHMRAAISRALYPTVSASAYSHQGLQEPLIDQQPVVGARVGKEADEAGGAHLRH